MHTNAEITKGQIVLSDASMMGNKLLLASVLFVPVSAITLALLKNIVRVKHTNATSKELKKSNADVEAQKWMNNIIDVNQNATKLMEIIWSINSKLGDLEKQQIFQ